MTHAIHQMKLVLPLILLLLHFVPAHAAPTLGDQKVLGVRVLFADASDAPSEDNILGLLNGAKNHFGNFSFDRLTLLPEVTTVTLNETRGSFGGDGSAMKSAVEKKLTQAGYRIGAYAIIGFYPGGSVFGNHSTVGGSQFISSYSGGSTLHEMGHNFAFKHQSVWVMEAGGAGPLARGDFKQPDPFHFMSGSSSITPSGVDPEPYEKWQREWITERYTVRDDGSYTFRVYTFDQKDADPANDKRTLMVNRGGGKGGSIWCGFRSTLLENNKHLNQGLVLYWQPDGATTSALIDAHPWNGYGPFGTSDHALQPGETWSDPPSEIHITNLGTGGTDPNKYIDVQVNRGPFSGNQAPSPTWDAPAEWTNGVPLTITVNGNDPDGDDVACMWETSNRNRPHNTSATNLTVTWNNPGYYEVKVEVSDMKGMTATKKKTILVRSATAITRTWDRDADNNLWHEAANWTGNTVPFLDDTVAFDGRTDPADRVNVNAATEVFDIEFSGDMKHFIQSDNGGTSGRILTINGNILNSSTANQVFRRNSNNGNALFIKMSAGDHVFDTAAGDILVKANLNGEGANLIKKGPHTLEFESWTGTEPASARNNYDGITMVQEGTLVLDKDDGTRAIAGDIIIGDGTGTDILVLRSNHQIANASQISFDGAGAVFRLNGNDEAVGGIHSLDPGSAGVIENNHTTSNSTLTVNSGDDSYFYGVIQDGKAGTLALVKSGAGTLALFGESTYNGGTTIGTGTLLVENSAGSATGGGAVQVDAGATLGGRGAIAGPVVISTDANLSPGSSMGTLTINNTLDLQGTTVMEVGRVDGTVSNDHVSGVSTLTCGGVLEVRDIGTDVLLAGDSFPLFAATTITGNFSNVVLPPLWPGLAWDSSTLTVDGTLRVTGALIPPRFDALDLSGTNAIITLEGSGGSPDFAYTIFSSTNLIDWSSEKSELFDDAGACRVDLLTDPEQPRMYYMLQGHPAMLEADDPGTP